MNALTRRLNRTFLPGLISTSRRALKSRILPLALCVAATVSADATTVIDSFNDITGGSDGLSLPSLNTSGIGGIGFTTKYEQTGSGVIVLRTNDLVTSLTNYVSGQGTNVHFSVAATIATSGAARRTQTRSFTSMAGTIWFSFLAELVTTNGDVALTFNGGFNSGASGSPASANHTPGMRVGLGSNDRATFLEALGVGPATAGATSLEITNIVNGVNGAVTAAGFVAVGTPVLVLGRIDSDPTNGSPRVSIWYNPDVPNVSSLPTPTLQFTDVTGTNVPSTITRIGYQVNRSGAPATQNEVIDNVKVSNEPNGFDIVYKNAPLPVPTISLVGTMLTGSEAGPTNIIFNIVSSAPVPTDTIVNYVLSGVATNGYDGQGGFSGADYTDPNFNQGIGMGSVTIPEGQTNVTVVLQVIDDSIPEGDESVIITLQNSSIYTLGAPSALTAVIIDNNDANVSLQYMFTHTLAAQVFDTNIIAAPANVAGLGGANYSSAYFISGDVSYNVIATSTGSNATQAVANGNYMGLTISPVAGRSLTLTNLNFEAVYGNYQFLVPTAANATVFVRSSLDGFTTNLAEFDMQPDNITFPNEWYSNNLDLGSAFSNIPGQIEFRLYMYDDSNNGQVGLRIDNIYFNGTTAALPVGLNQVEFTTNIVNASEPATPGQFTLVRQGDTTGALTVNYTVSGTASNGVDYMTLPGTATFAAGQSNAVITVTPIDDDIPEPTETITLTLIPGTNYGVLTPGSATMSLFDDGDVGIGALVAYFFNEDNNAAASLSAVAVPTIKQTNAVTALNASVGTGCGPFGRNAAGVGNGYADSASYSPPSTFYVRGQFWGLTETDALTNNFYLSLTVAPTAAHSITLTNFSAQMLMSGNVGQEGFAFLRSSVDNFAADLGAFAVPDTEVTPPPFLLWNIPLAMSNLTSAVEFRVYMYGLTNSSAVVLRLDDATFYGSAMNAVISPAQPKITGITVTNGVVQIGFTDNSGASAFNLQSSGNVGSGYANVNSATMATNAVGQFTFSATASGTAQFYRISR